MIEFPDAGHHPGPFVLWSLAGIAGIVETFGGFALLIGLWTRPVAFILSGEMAVAYFMVHLPSGLDRPRGYFPIVNEGDLAILFSFVFLFLVFQVWRVQRGRSRIERACRCTAVLFGKATEPIFDRHFSGRIGAIAISL